MSEIKVIQGYECRACGDWFDQEEDAFLCCAPGVYEMDRFICPECDNQFEGRSEAISCCN